ncbi:rhodanese-related sulfurtransferase [Methylobacillus flagellatus]|uniref:oxygen-dependent tRNA uridine(34) hydroxylase TrhO n=1 Tax=Methylobacillus flagellatus TaxID=405 RepID=UPI0010F818F9|nr:rhodanese-related sulfurtransferase [Methylobacillus flagellatus]
MSKYLTAALYKFVSLPDYREQQGPLLAICVANQIKGTLLLAEEGINGTIAGLPEQIHTVLRYLREDASWQGRLADLEHKESWAEHMPFYRMKVRLKQEIVKLGVPEVKPSEMAGTYVKPEDWNALISDPDVILVDTRNDYEVAIGTFQGAINPETKSFTELPAWVKEHTELKQKPKVAMFCTGGIRCEKSTAYLRSQGFEEVYHLQGGILNYLETVPAEQSLWQGECFVFDERVSVGHGLQQGDYQLCRACRFPLGPEDRTSPHYVLGVSCAHCHDQTTPEQKLAFAERQRQVELAEQRNAAHIGARYTPHQHEG